MLLLAFGAILMIVCTSRSSTHKALDMVMKFPFHWQKSLVFLGFRTPWT